MYFRRALLFELVKRMLKSVNKNQRYCKIKVAVFWNKAYMQKYGNNRHQFVLTKCRWQMTTSDFECNSANMRMHIVKCTSRSLTVVMHYSVNLFLLFVLVFVHPQHCTRARVWSLLEQWSRCCDICSSLRRVPCFQTS